MCGGKNYVFPMRIYGVEKNTVKVNETEKKYYDYFMLLITITTSLIRDTKYELSLFLASREREK